MDYDLQWQSLGNTSERYSGGMIKAPMDDFERLQLHDILRSLACQLYGVSEKNLEISKREQAGGILSIADHARRQDNHVRMSRIEDLIRKTSKDIVSERA